MQITTITSIIPYVNFRIRTYAAYGPVALTSLDPWGYPSTRTVSPRSIAPDLSEVY